MKRRETITAEHGTTTRYREGCRCDLCRAAKRRYYATDKGKAVKAKERRRYYATNRGKTAKAKENRRYRARYPQKRRAYKAVDNAVKSGRLTRPEICDGCGDKGRIEGHHENGYSKEHELDVRWLCQPCHRARHS